jgi:hypothetical protein
MSPTRNRAANLAGSSAFDFDGDGRAEAVHSDQCFTRIYDGVTGRVVYSRPRTSCLWYENPVIADTDGDLNAELVTTSNGGCGAACPALDPLFDGVRCADDTDCVAPTRCGRDQPGDALGRCRCSQDPECGDGYACRDPIAGPSPAGKVCRAAHPVGVSAGVRVIADAADRWIGARPIWNQHAYSVTNVNDDGTVPRTSMWLRNWSQPGLNNFRQNAPGSGLGAGASPDLTVRGATVTCIPGGARVAIEVCNRGTEPVARGLPVSVYGGNPPSTLGCTAHTMFNLVVGECETVSCDWPAAGTVGTVIVDDDGTGSGGMAGQGQNLECREDNNRLVLTNINCGV